MSKPVVLTPTGRKVVAIYGSQLVDDVAGIETEAVRMGQEAGEALGAYRGVDAFLASPQAAEELARALLRLAWPDWSDGKVWPYPGDEAETALVVLAAWQKVRHPEEGS